MESLSLGILFLEDSEVDAAAVVRMVTKAGYTVESLRVETEEDFRAALQQRKWDVVIADYHLPSWTGIEALQMFKSNGLDIPFIIVSGVIDEESAVVAMKSGAHDFITKGKLARLLPALERELHETKIRAAQRRAERERALLAEAGRLFAMPLDYEGTLAGLARAVVRWFADWCVIDVAVEDGGLMRSQAVHADPERQFLLDRLPRYQPPDVRSRAMEVFDSGLPRIVSQSASESASWFDDEDQNATVDAIGCSSYISVPLIANGHALGVASFCYSDPLSHYTNLDLDLAVELARRTAIVIDNARLFRQAQQANRLKDQFLAMVSHELRTPLTPILGAVHMIKTHSGNPEILGKSIEIIERNAKMQARIVDDLLDIGRIASGKLTMRSAPLDLGEVIRAALDGLRTTPKAAQLVIESSLEPINGTVFGDSWRIEQVLSNLLSNASKFTAPGGKVMVSLVQPSPDRVRIAVSDTGKGIDPDFLPFVFDRFRQEDRNNNHFTGGLGLGLAIARDLVELHRGQIVARSAGPGQGATFAIELPVSVGVDAAGPAPEHRESTKSI